MELRGLELTMLPAGEQNTNAWFSDSAAGLVGGVGGGLLGLFGAFIGIQSRRGKSRSLVLGGMRLLVVVGVIILLISAAAFLIGQPYHVWFPLGLIGLLLALVLGLNLRGVARRYSALVEQKMRASDLR